MDWLLPALAGALLGASAAAAILLWRHGAALVAARSERDRAAAEAEGSRRERDAADLRAREAAARLLEVDKSREHAERTLAVERERLASLEDRLQQEGTRLEELRASLRDAFRLVGQEVTQGGLEQLRRSMAEMLEAKKKEIDAEGEARRQAIAAHMKPIQEGLLRQAEAIQKIEEKREGAYAGLRQLVEQIGAGHGELRDQTSRLVQALRRPETRGRWGEFTLRNAVEQAGLSPHCDFAEQVSVEVEEGRLRPDLVINLPGGGSIVVDSKVALDGFLSMLESDADRPALLRRHAAAVAGHVKSLGQKKYWEQFARAPEFVVMFVPIESALAAAIEAEPAVFEDAVRQRVILTGPMNLAALLRVIAMGWREHDVAENARRIADEAAELHKRLRKFAEALGEVGQHLHKAGVAYNKAVGSFEARLLPAARRMEQYGAAKEPMEALPPVEVAPPLRQPQLPGGAAGGDPPPIDVEASGEPR